MVTAKRRDDWDHTASLKCQLANMFRDGGRAYVPAEFNPLRQHCVQARRHGCSVQQLTAAFVGI